MMPGEASPVSLISSKPPMNELSSDLPSLSLVSRTADPELLQLAQAVCSTFPAKFGRIRQTDELLALAPSDSDEEFSDPPQTPALLIQVDADESMSEDVAAALAGPLRCCHQMIVRDKGVELGDQVIGSCDWGVIERPVRSEWLIDRMTDMLESTSEQTRLHRMHASVDTAINRLTERQQTVLGSIVKGLPTKTIAKQLGVSNRLIEMERSVLLRQFSVTSTPELTLKYGQYDAYRTILKIRHRQAHGWLGTDHVVPSAC